MELTIATILVAFAGVFLICFMKGAFGGGFSIIGIPLLSMVMDPVTAGGLVTVDASLIGLLAAFGASGSLALAADIMWRATTFVPQVLTGASTFLWWRLTPGRRRQAASNAAPGNRDR